MAQTQTIISIISVIVAAIGIIISTILSLKNLKYNKEIKRLQNEYDNLKNEYDNKTIELNTNIEIITNREKMLELLKGMYNNAEARETIWGQSVSGHIIGNVTKEVVDAATRGVHFEMIFSEEGCKKTSSKRALVELFTLLPNNASVYAGKDNNLRIQGISTKEVIIAIPDNDKYVALLIKDEAIIKVFRDWFVSRLKEVKKLKKEDLGISSYQKKEKSKTLKKKEL